MDCSCWTCKYFTYWSKADCHGWCRRYPPIRDIQRDAIAPAITGCVEVSIDDWCGEWATDKRTRQRVEAEFNQAELQYAYYTLAHIDYARAEFEKRIENTNDLKELESIEREIDRFLKEIDDARRTIKRLGENVFMESDAARVAKEMYGG